MPIKIKVREVELPKPIPEGLYQASVKEITEGSGEYGKYLKFSFEITEGEEKGTNKTAIASQKLSRSKSGKVSKLYSYFKALTKKEPETGEEIDIESLIGKNCQILVKNDKEVDGIMMQKITDIMPVKEE